MSEPVGGDARDYARELQARAAAVLIKAGHRDCQYLHAAKYVPEAGAVVCGCGEFEPHTENADNPPWSPHDSDYADATPYDEGPPDFDGPIGDGPQGPPAAPPARRPGGTLTYEAADPIASTLALIDPSEQYTPVDVERHILDVLYRLETGALFERETVVKAYQTAQEYTLAYEKAIHLSEQSSADKRKAEATVKTETQFRAMSEAKMLKEAAKQTMHNLRAILSGYQSTARSVGSAYQAGGSQGGTPSQGSYPR